MRFGSLELRPDFAEAWFQLAMSYFRKSLYVRPEQRHLGALHLAIRCYREAEQLSPRLAPLARKEVANLERNLPPQSLSWVYSQLGDLYREEGLDQEARSSYRRALRASPNNRHARESMELCGQN